MNIRESRIFKKVVPLLKFILLFGWLLLPDTTVIGRYGFKIYAIGLLIWVLYKYFSKKEANCRNDSAESTG